MAIEKANAVATALVYICDLILENRQYPHNFQMHFICSLFSTGTEEWNSQDSAS